MGLTLLRCAELLGAPHMAPRAMPQTCNIFLSHLNVEVVDGAHVTAVRRVAGGTAYGPASNAPNLHHIVLT
jgi:hypothetical protein